MKPLFLALVLCCLSTSLASAASTEFEYEFELDFESDFSGLTGPRGNQAELLIVSPLLKKRPLGSFITIYELDGRYYLPLFTLSRLVELGIHPIKGAQGARGFVIDESREFRLDLEKSSVEYGGQRGGFDVAMVRRQPDDIYVVQELLSQWLPIDFEVHRLRSALEVRPREKMPIELRWEREERLQNRAFPNKDKNYRRLSNEYRLFDGPFIDETVTVRAINEGDAFIAHSTYLAADVAYLEANAYAGGDADEPLQTYRLSLGRRDPYARLLGPLGAREFQAVDVFSPRLRLLWPYRQVRGAMVSSYPLGGNGELGSRTFEGDLPPGWTVELYRGDFLLDYRKADLSGRYVFADIPLEFGYNDYRLVFYGPYGQRREESHESNIAEAIPTPGNVYYHVGGGQDLAGATRLLAQADYGLSPFMAARVGMAHSSGEDRSSNYAITGLRSVLGPMFASGDVYLSAQESAALVLGAYSRVDDVSIFSEYDYAGETFESEVVAPGTAGLLDRTRLGADAYLNYLPVPLTFGLTGMRDRFRLAHTSYALVQRAGFSWQHLALGHRFEWRRITHGAPFANAGLTVSRSLDVGSRVLLLGDFNYEVHPQFDPTQFGLRVSSLLAQRYLGFLGFRRAFRGSTAVEAGVAKEFSYLGMQLNGAFVHPNHFEVMTMLTTGLSMSSRQQQIHSEGRQVAKEGNLLVRAFLDTNQNGRWDAGERPVPDVTVFIDDVSHAERTGRNGTVLIRHVVPYEKVDVSVSADRVGDPSWQPTGHSVAVVTRPGRSLELDFPFQFTGEIEGTVFLQAGGHSVERAGVPVQLVDAQGGVVGTQWSAYDGFYLFTKVPTGNYTVRIPDDFARTWGTTAPKRPVEVNENEPVVFGADLILRRR